MKTFFTLFLIFLSHLLNAQSTELFFEVKDTTYLDGEIVRVDFKVRGFNQIAGYQFGLTYDTLNLQLAALQLPNPTPIPMANLNDSMFVDFNDTLLIPDCIQGNFGFCVDGEIRHVWVYPFSATTDDGSLIFSLYFLALEDGKLSENLLIAPQILNNIAHLLDLTPIPVTLLYYNENNQTTSSIKDDLLSNVTLYPNPFITHFNVNFEGNFEGFVFGVDGKLIYEFKNQTSVYLPELQRGVYILKINEKVFKIVKK